MRAHQTRQDAEFEHEKKRSGRISQINESSTDFDSNVLLNVNRGRNRLNMLSPHNMGSQRYNTIS
jgi:hypothetical protein